MLSIRSVVSVSSRFSTYSSVKDPATGKSPRAVAVAEHELKIRTDEDVYVCVQMCRCVFTFDILSEILSVQVCVCRCVGVCVRVCMCVIAGSFPGVFRRHDSALQR